jgi:hypothetical protein
MSIDGGTVLGHTEVGNNSCQNCGHHSHCGNTLGEEAYSGRGDRLGVIEICRQCRCNSCEKK